jgi:hypothetical protein
MVRISAHHLGLPDQRLRAADRSGDCGALKSKAGERWGERSDYFRVTITMVEHLIELCDRIVGNKLQGREHFDIYPEIHREIQKLDPKDFEQAAQADFMIARGAFAHLVNPNKRETPTGTMVSDAARKLRVVLDHYAGEDSHLDRIPFTFLRDPILIGIVKRDHKELRLRSYPGRAWKSTVILAGSILEAILTDVLSGPTQEAQANAFAATNPRYRSKGPIADGQWVLEALIDAAVSLRLIRAADAKVVHQTLRDSRNFVHPMKEYKNQLPVGEHEAGLAVHALEVVIDHLERTFHP